MGEAPTIAAIATAPGRAGVAVVRVSGPDAFQVAKSLTGLDPVVGRVRLARFKGPRGELLDEGLVLLFQAPHSYTGEDVVEFQCHGGQVCPVRILEACFAAGARLARRGEFTRRAFLNGRLDYDRAAAVLDLIDARTVRAADAALSGLSGARQMALRGIYESVLALSAELENALDVSEDDLPSSFFSIAEQHRQDALLLVRAELRRLREGKILREGALVVLAGPPNAGKSSLMNALLDERRAIVSDIPGTTRDSIEEGMDIDGWPIRLVDTAGLRVSDDAIEREGVRRSQNLIAAADVVLALGNASDFPREKTILVHAKCDLGLGEGLNVSAKTGEGLEALKRAVVERIQNIAVKSVDDGKEGNIDVLLNVDRILSEYQFGKSSDLVLFANAVRSSAQPLGELLGAVYSDDLLDRLFSRFCVGK